MTVGVSVNPKGKGKAMEELIYDLILEALEDNIRVIVD